MPIQKQSELMGSIFVPEFTYICAIYTPKNDILKL